MKMKRVSAVAAGLLLATGMTAGAAERSWSLEVTPYAWLTGIDADVAVGDKKGEIDVGFEDLVDYLDVGGGLLMIAEKNGFLLWGQMDYFALSSDEDTTKFEELATLDVDLMIVEAGVGYQFDNPLSEKGKLDVMGGVRYTKLETTFDPKGPGVTRDSDSELTDGMLIVRPWFPITKKLAFNPTLGVGAGDSDLIYELQPQLQYRFNDTVLGRIGYRRLYYDVEGDRGNFDGSFEGLIVGVGFML